MFQDINVAKSAPFALLTIYQKSMYPPKYSKGPHFGKLCEIRRPFFDLDHEKWKPQISQQIARNSLNLPITMANHAKSTRLSLISTIPCSLSVPQLFTANLTKCAQFANTWCESHEINQLRTNFNKSSIFFLDTCKTGSNTLLARITRISQPYVGIRKIFASVFTL